MDPKSNKHHTNKEQHNPETPANMVPKFNE